MAILFGVLPWIVYAIVSSVLPVAPAVALAGAVAVVAAGVRMARGARPAELTIDITTAVFFVAAGVLAAAADGGIVQQFLGAASEFTLAAAVGVGLWRGRPFTEAIARRQVPSEVAATSGFHDFNVRITRVWFASFLVAGVVLLAAVLLFGPAGRYATYVIVPLSILIPVRYTARLTRGASDVPATAHN